MSKDQAQRIRTATEVVGLLVGIVGGLAGIAGMFGAFYLLPFRVSAVERGIESVNQRVATVAEQRDADHELLTRIEERLIAVQSELKKRP